ncbi:MAG TPA: hypothetical protein VFR32_07515 [Gaiellaceae bacterium]|nr:hypothetical protein [Gaiellaceae bacterium]
MNASAHMDGARSAAPASGLRANRRRRGGALLLATALVATVAVLPAQAGPAVRSVGPVVMFMTTTEVPGAWSALVRTEDAVAATFHTSGLEPGSAATLWWVFFNNPAACVDECNLPDLFVPAVQASVQFAAGHLIGGAGIANYGGYIGEGDTSGCASPTLPCNGLLDSQEAEVHLVVRTHGQALPGVIDEQISSFNGGCNPTCANVQASVHLP